MCILDGHVRFAGDSCRLWEKHCHGAAELWPIGWGKLPFVSTVFDFIHLILSLLVPGTGFHPLHVTDHTYLRTLRPTAFSKQDHLLRGNDELG